jgi:energy-coupling factor transport system substrate-specific component
MAHNISWLGVRGRGPGAAGAPWLVGLVSLIGLAAFLYPFLLPALRSAIADERSVRASEAPLVLAAVAALCLFALMAELSDGNQAPGAASKRVALLGALVATDATLRLAPSFLGASPIFLLIILAGGVFGPAVGFVMGAMTLFVSAFLTGGVGPWLPYQMLGAGWVGLTAGWLPRPVGLRRRLVVLAVFGTGWGFLYGALLNLTTWPFAAPGLASDVGLYWTPDLSSLETLRRYSAYYLTTSLLHDLFRAAGNAALILILGGPLLRLLERFRARFAWESRFESPSLPRQPSVPT